jgi:hypothetical protein
MLPCRAKKRLAWPGWLDGAWLRMGRIVSGVRCFGMCTAAN